MLWAKIVPNQAEDSLVHSLPSLTGNEKINAFQKIGTHYRNTDKRLAIFYFKEGLSYAKISNDKNWESVFYYEIGRIHRSTASDSSLFFFKASLALAEGIGNKVNIARACNEIGIFYQHKGKLSEGLQFYLRALQAAEDAQDNNLIGDCYNNIGFIYKGQLDFKRAISYFEKSLAIREQLGDKQKIAGVLNNIGITLMAQDKYKEARAYYQKALDLFNEEENPAAFAMLYNNFGVTYENEGAYGAAHEYYLKSIGIKEKLDDKRGIASTYGNIGANFRKAKNWNEAIRYSKLSLAMATELGALDYMRTAAHNLSMVYEIKQDYRNAFVYHKQFKDLQDSIFSDNKAEEIAEMISAYESEKKDREHELLKKDSMIQSEMLQRQRYLALSIVLGLLLILGLVILRYVRHRKKVEIEKLQLALHLQQAKAETDSARAELNLSQEQLQAYTHRLLEHSALIEALKEQLQLPEYNINDHENKKRLTNLNSLIQSKLLTDEDWDRFRQLFERVYPGFFTQLRDHFDDLTPAEVRLMALVRLKLNTKEIATMLGISAQTVYKTRQRLRAKIGNSAEALLNELELAPL